MTANGEVQTREEATVYVKEMDMFVTVMLLEETLAVLSLGKLCEDHGYTYHWTSGQKPHLIRNGKRIDCNVSNCVSFIVPGSSSSSSTSSSSSSTQDSVFDVSRYTESPVPERSGNRREGFPRTRITKRSCVCDCEGDLFLSARSFSLSLFLSFSLSFSLSFFLAFFLS